ncbi:MAG TPA: class I SAM-dependent methyltransferase [Thermoanaerobaculia bacterium]|nr:class I SAM-dependent methyltransferase [Thermoanaerobaculia bacterium]
MRNRVPFMDLTFLLPRTAHAAIEERFGSWQTELLLKRDAPEALVVHYDSRWSGEQLLDLVETDYVIALTDPTALPPPGFATRLLQLLEDPAVDAALPAANESSHPDQRKALPEPYLTLRQFETASAAVRSSGPPPLLVEWGESDPGAFAAAAEMLDRPLPLPRILKGRRVAIAPELYLHRYTSHRGQVRPDLLERIPLSARSVLEFGCGEGALGAALKERQPCRVLGIELDPEAAAIASRRLDGVLSGDARDVIYKLKEKFDTIVGGDILEHLDDPWSFLAGLRNVAEPGALLLLSLPNVANWAIIDDLLHGRFDYVHLGILCAGHLRFFTRRSIEEMIGISGWTLVSIESQPKVLTSRYRDLISRMESAGIEFSRDDLEAPGYYVVARNDSRSE